jgi:PIN domain nuclease of toxin-antitoxin system
MGCFKISAVNLSETVSKLIQVGMHPADAWKVVTGFGPTICAYDESTARAAIELAPLAWTHGVSFADRACLVTAQLLGIPAVTADRKWSSLPLPCQVICIR